MEIKTELTAEQSQKLADWGFSPRDERKLFDLTDLLMLLPEGVTITDSDGEKYKKTGLSMVLFDDGWEVQYDIRKRAFITMQNAELIDAVYQIVIWCIENGNLNRNEYEQTNREIRRY